MNRTNSYTNDIATINLGRVCHWPVDLFHSEANMVCRSFIHLGTDIMPQINSPGQNVLPIRGQTPLSVLNFLLYSLFHQNNFRGIVCGGFMSWI